MFVVGTVLYRNLGSFLALQRWAPRARGVGVREARPGGGEGAGLLTPTRPAGSPPGTRPS